MKTLSKFLCQLAIGCSLMLFLAGCETTSPAKGNLVPSAFKREDVKKMALIVPLGGRQEGFENVIETTFLSSLLPKGYDIVTRQSLEHIAKELVRTRDEAFDASTASKLGKLANASHIVVIKMPMLDRNVNRQTHSTTYNVFITAQVIEVETGRILMVAQGKTSALDSMITINGGQDAGAVIAKVAKRAADQIP
jgi:hypothetical protein